MTTSKAMLTGKRPNLTSLWSWCLVVLTILAACNVGFSEAQRYNRIFGPMLGKRTQTESAGEEVFDFNVPDDSQKTETSAFDFAKSTTCPLDSLFMQLTPEWQQMIMKMMRQARYKS
ncbi:uncharacterized protein LOC115919535 [Strongylocentrotus purpuratus]|uniref:Uncharacterized protein n=1 Tax=Strongylocentrotus purpuratus TaxID=7668 RepID=A0A7M7N101_STRPU|nr:uncharacterized protein LOC115919535 [Strongylocentrotus purpuratus]|eukprot:XP_011678829.1 PREDICTED: uncharacterized protein LOC105445241 isoform X1 [Strongylocentrotus purpuratus]